MMTYSAPSISNSKYAGVSASISARYNGVPVPGSEIMVKVQ